VKRVFVNTGWRFNAPGFIKTEHMNSPTDGIRKRPCAFIVKTHNPLQTLGEIVKILLERQISVSNMYLECFSDRQGILIIHCQLEKDRSRYVLHLLEKIKGIIEVELLENKTTNPGNG
jgi:hypothetical protein